ncbi:MAG: hypothetical protein II886_11375 [Prevotella sp.]|nr:hypothetical protein [Prevotella sp.]
MKKVLMTMTLLLTLSSGLQAAAQKHRHTPQQEELVDSTNKDAVEVFSDTTSTAASTTADDWMADEDDVDERIERAFSRTIFNWDSKDTAGVLLVLGVLFIIFVLAPLIIIIALFYFINKNRKQKMRLAQMAMQQGQPIPEQLLNENSPSNLEDEYQKGMRQCFVGVGLMIFLGYAAGEVGFGIGALVFCIGLGKVFASKTAQKREERNNDLIQNNYDKETSAQ